jgi:hypothetical protein
MLATSEVGKTLKSSHAEVEKCAMTFEWFAEHGPAILADESVEAEGTDRIHVSFLPQRPRGLDQAEPVRLLRMWAQLPVAPSAADRFSAAAEHPHLLLVSSLIKG